MADPRTFLKDHQLAVLGTLAGVAVAAVTVFRKTPAPVVQVTAPASSGGTSSADLLSAFGAGSTAASAGFDTGAALGQAGIGAAGQAESDVASVAAQLAQSQVQLAGQLGSLFNPVPTPLPQPNPNPTPTPTLHHAVAIGVPYAGIAPDPGGVRQGIATVHIPTGTSLVVVPGTMNGFPAWVVYQGQYAGYAFNSGDPKWSVS